MNFKLFKLNLKIAWMRASGRINKINENLHFTSDQILSPNILIIFPINKEEITKSMDAISGIINSQKNIDANFSLIVNSNMNNKFNFYKIKTFSLIVFKSGKIDNSSDVIDKLYFKKFDIIIDLNINFNVEIAMIVNELNSTYKIGFVSKYSDYFYNVQLKANNENVYKPIKDIIA